MRTIQNPSIKKLILLLFPALFFSILFILTGMEYFWMMIIAITLLVAHIILVTYFCIKQKCYRQLANAAMLFGTFIGYFALIIYISKH